MTDLLFIDPKNFSDFIERFLINAISPPIFILLAILLYYRKKIKFKIHKPFIYIVVLYVLMDLVLRLYYTFILNMENQTRYFLIQAIFYLIPAALAWEFLINKYQAKKQLIGVGICSVIFLFGVIKSLKPKWNKPEYESFSKIIKEDPEPLKYVLEVKKGESGDIKINNDFRLLYYSGIYRDKETKLQVQRGEGSLYFITEEEFVKLGNYQIELIAEVEEKGEDKLYLYKVKR